MKKNLGINAFKRYLSLKTHHLYALPIIILMPHSGCNCRCIMCDIWKRNGDVRQLTADDVQDLLRSLKKLETEWVVMSGGEALMNANLFRLCEILRAHKMKITILSTGLLLKRYAAEVVAHTDEVIVSLDGSEKVHNAIRRIPKAYQKLVEGVQSVKTLKPHFHIGVRSVIQQANFLDWPNIVEAAHTIGLDQISFLPADVSTPAFNRPDLWAEDQVDDVKLSSAQLPQLKQVIEEVIRRYQADFVSGYIAESPDKLRRIYDYYAAFHDICDFPSVQCNAPWVSAVVEADGTLRPCFFHQTLGNIHQTSFQTLLNGPEAIAFRQNLDLATNTICRQCVCSLNLRPTTKLETSIK